VVAGSSILIAQAELSLVGLLRAAIAPPLVCDRVLPRHVIVPEPRFEPRPVHEPEPRWGGGLPPAAIVAEPTRELISEVTAETISARNPALPPLTPEHYVGKPKRLDGLGRILTYVDLTKEPRSADPAHGPVKLVVRRVDEAQGGQLLDVFC
jgi:hypothetical protein